MSDDRFAHDADVTRCWRSECRNGCYYPDVCSERPTQAATNNCPCGTPRACCVRDGEGE